jgi:hypothetical protein
LYVRSCSSLVRLPCFTFYDVLRRKLPVTFHVWLERTGNCECTRGIFRAQGESGALEQDCGGDLPARFLHFAI